MKITFKNCLRIKKHGHTIGIISLNNVIQYQYVKLMEKSIECTKSKILEQISQTGIDIYQTSDQIEIVGGTNTKK